MKSRTNNGQHAWFSVLCVGALLAEVGRISFRLAQAFVVTAFTEPIAFHLLIVDLQCRQIGKATSLIPV